MEVQSLIQSERSALVSRISVMLGGDELDLVQALAAGARKLSRNLVVSATSPGGVIETAERSFAVELQRRAELTSCGAAQLVAEALVDAAARRAA